MILLRLCIFVSFVNELSMYPFIFLAFILQGYKITVLPPPSESSSASPSSLYINSSLTVLTLTFASIAFPSGLIRSEKRQILRR